MNSDISLDLESYSLDDIVKLFGMQTLRDVKEQDMKAARKIVMMTHPDKSGLGKEYFQFFAKAYERLCSVTDFMNRTSQTDNKYQEKHRKIDVEVSRDSTNFAAALKKAKILTDENTVGEGWGKWKGEFDKWFEKHGELAADANGYEEFMKSTADLLPEGASKEEAAMFMESRKRSLGALVTREAVVGLDSWNAQGGSAFGQGTGEDLRKAYTETVVPVTDEDFQRMRKYSSLDEYKRARHGDDNVSQAEYTTAIDEYRREKANEQAREVAEYYEHLREFERNKDYVSQFQRSILRIAR